MIQDAIVNNAISFVGEQEIRGNLGFNDDTFQEYMEAVGWQEKQAWCAYFVELVWKLSYATRSSAIVKELDALFSASAVQTYRNFNESTRWGTSNHPQKGGLVVWQTHIDDEPLWSGHIGIVKKVMDHTSIESIEGNTNAAGGREGIEVATKNRVLIDSGRGRRLVYLGCVKPMEV
jgi:hypothetical protein